MNFDQGQFNFNANGPEDGYRKWREELATPKSPQFRIKGVIFTMSEVESIVQVERE